MKLWITGLAVGSVLVAGCGVPTDRAPRELDPRAAPFRALSPVDSPTPAGATRALVYLAQDNVLVGVARRVSAATPEALLGSLVAGPLARERDAGIGTAVPKKAELDGPVTTSGIVRINLPAPDDGSSGRTDEILGLAQLVLTLSTLPAVKAVQFVRDGKALAVPRADGSLTSDPVTRRDYAALL